MSQHTQTHKNSHIFRDSYITLRSFFHVVSFTTTASQLPNTVFLCVPVITDTHVFVTECICLVCMCVCLWMLCLSCVFAQTYSAAVLPPMSDVRRVPIRLPLTHISYFHTSVTALFSSTGAIPECFVDYAGPEFRNKYGVFANKRLTWTLISLLSV